MPRFERRRDSLGDIFPSFRLFEPSPFAFLSPFLAFSHPYVPSPFSRSLLFLLFLYPSLLILPSLRDLWQFFPLSRARILRCTNETNPPRGLSPPGERCTRRTTISIFSARAACPSVTMFPIAKPKFLRDRHEDDLSWYELCIRAWRKKNYSSICQQLRNLYLYSAG